MQETTFTLELKSHPKNISVIEPYINQVVEAYDVDHEMYGNILISLTEAVNNAIMHGNDGDEDKMVRVGLKKNNKNLVFSISDDGAGFNYDDLPDPTAPENILKLGGRGIFLMKQLADLVIFSDKGNTVEIQFNL
jgi:serine/threonine-protein kinase RsbW